MAAQRGKFMVELVWKSLKEMLDVNLCDLTRQSWEESWAANGVMDYDPDWDRYAKLEINGYLRMLAAVSDNDIVGYVSVTLDREFLDRKKKTAIVNAFFLSPEYRSGWNGIKFIKDIESHLKFIGAHRIMFSERTEMKIRLGKIFTFLGYTDQEHLWIKNLGVSHG